MISVEANFYLPPGFAGDTYGIVPDSVVVETALRHNLTGRNLRGIDPACGAGTIPRVLRRMGGVIVDAGDINKDHCKIVQKLLGCEGGEIFWMDLTDSLVAGPYDFVYTSLPFSLFDSEVFPDLAYARGLLKLVDGKGKVIIDSADMVRRGKEMLPVADRQVRYLSAQGLKLVDKIRYRTNKKVEGFDGQFTELVFVPS